MKAGKIVRLFLYVILISFWFSLSCDFKPIQKPKLPRWFTKLNIPLIDKTYPFSDLAGDTADTSNPIQVGADSVLKFYFEGLIDTARITKENLLVPTATIIEQSIDIPAFSNIDVDTTIKVDNSFRLNDLLGISVDSAIVPPIDPDTVVVDTAAVYGPFFPDSIPFFKSISHLNIAGGYIKTRIVNNLPDPMNLTKVHVWVKNDLGEFLSTTGADQTIVPGDSLVQQDDLTNQHLTNYLTFDISMYIGSTSQAIYVAADSPGVVFEITFNITSIDSVVGQVDTIKQEYAFQISQERNRIQIGVIDDTLSPDFSLNKLRYRLTSDFPLASGIKITLVNFIDRDNGEPLVIQDTLSSGATGIDTLNLNGDTLRAETPRDFVDSLKFVSAFYILPNHGDSLVALPTSLSESTISSQIAITDIQLKKLTGILNASFELPPQTIQNIPTGFGMVAFSRVILEIVLTNEIQAATILNLDMVGRRGATTVSKHIQANIRSAPSDTSYSVDTIRTNVAEIFNLVPDTIYISGAASVPTDTTSTIEYGKRVYGKYSIDVPFYVALDTMVFIPVTTNRVPAMDSLTADQVNRSLISASIISDIINNTTMSGRMDLLISNLNFFPYYDNPDSFHLPLGDTIFFIVDTSGDSLVYGIDEEGDSVLWRIDTLVSIALPSAELQDGMILNPGQFFAEDVLDSNSIDFLTEQKTHYIVPRIEMYGTAGDTVQVSARDYIHVKAFVSFVLDMEAIINPEDTTAQGDTGGVLIKPVMHQEIVPAGNERENGEVIRR